MRHHLFSATPSNTLRCAILIKETSFLKPALEQHYVEPLVAKGIPAEEIVAFTLTYDEPKKVAVSTAKAYLTEDLLPALKESGAEVLYVADSTYFKVLAGVTKADPHMGYALPCKMKGYEHLQVCYGVNYQGLVYNPDLQAKIDLSIEAAAGKLTGAYQEIGQGIVHYEAYPRSVQAIAAALNDLHQHPHLTADIEGFSLRFNECGIATIAFAWDEHNGIAFACDYKEATEDSTDVYLGFSCRNDEVRQLLKQFFMSYQGTITWHNGAFDLKPIIYNLWMEGLADTRGLLRGLDVMYRGFEDTKIIAYLATNSTADAPLGLKALAHEYVGNYAKEDIKDIRRIPLDELLRYNLMDALATFYVKKKFTPIMERDNQGKLYRELMLPSQKLLTQMELTGMPMDRAKLAQVRAKLEKISAENIEMVHNSREIAMMTLLLQGQAVEKKNAKLVKKRVTTADFADLKFNPRSPLQLQHLLYELMGLPILDRTDSGQPATGNETLKKLLNHTDQETYKQIIKAIMAFLEAEKILTTFIPAFEKGLEKAPDGIIWLFGSFNIGGTVSGRLSSSDPNLQNIPANSTFGKLIKEIFRAPDGWLFCGADFNSLEDRISALTTKDPNKLKVYEDGYDGHALRAVSYWPEEMPDIDPTSVESVNAISDKKHPYYGWRQESKAPTFLLTYGGTFHGMMSNLGWTMEKSQKVEEAYHKLYAVSDAYVERRLKQACQDGYVEVAFGLRVRTPLLAQCLWNSVTMPYEAKAEGRTAGNALGQSYGLLNNRAAVDFWNKVWASPYRYDILPSALIHDAIYAVIRNDPAIMAWANKELVASMSWQELPELVHPRVKIGAALDIFWPNWSNPITLPVVASAEDIIITCKAGKAAYLEEQAKKGK